MSDTTTEVKPHKRFLVFGYYNYESSGGLKDMINDFDSIQDCKDFIKTHNSFDTCEIYDRIQGVEIPYKK